MALRHQDGKYDHGEKSYRGLLRMCACSSVSARAVLPAAAQAQLETLRAERSSLAAQITGLSQTHEDLKMSAYV